MTAPLATTKRARRFDRVSFRNAFNLAVTALALGSVLVVLVPLASIIYTAAARGGSVLFTPGFLTALAPLPCSPISCSNAGIGPALQGTLLILGMATGLSSVVGISAALFSSEYRTSWLGRAISFTADVLTGVPSIIMGVFVYAYFSVYYPTIVFSFFTGTLALSALMIPFVVRATEEALHTVPNAIREAALALGIPKWRTTVRIVLTTALPGVMTGVLVAAMRAAGDAAPLLFTLFGSRLYFQGVFRPGEALPLMIYSFAESPYSNWLAIAWGATLVLIVLVLAANVLARLSIQRLERRMAGR